ncbi:MAG: alpha/beta hydrolase fold domain-containing protein [Caulobacteraceae bacterium]
MSNTHLKGVARGLVAGLLLGLAGAGGTLAQDRQVRVDGDGTVHAPATSTPPSNLLSPEGRAYLADHLMAMQHPERLGEVNGVPKLLQPYLARQTALFPLARQDTSIAGVHAYVYTPKGGVDPRNSRRVLINLHGGGFSGCWPACAELESMPVASLGRIKVISLDYRQGPKHHFPAASEDVAAVYRELLKTYRPQNIGIYGCSAGGMLTGMAVAWFKQHGLPKPGAVGMLCAGGTLADGGFGGDANYVTMPIGEARMPPSAAGSAPSKAGPTPIGYLSGVDVNDPLAAPVASKAVLAWFPPTLFVTGTRSFDLSSSVYTHGALVKAGAQAELHVWDGMFHGFFYNPDVPESREVFDVIVKFFDRRLGH